MKKKRAWEGLLWRWCRVWRTLKVEKEEGDCCWGGVKGVLCWSGRVQWRQMGVKRLLRWVCEWL